ncbi:MAG: hypothetical protein K5851_02490 [Lachnospiraceae bacterium]|nr:hypothetical protein [Lachnospiraceae bacterium]
MKTYIKNYRYRLSGIIMSIALAFLAVLLSAGIFGNRINALSNQLKHYQDSEYNIAYILNYSVPAENELIYADTDIQLFLDENGNERLAVSCLMPLENEDYTLTEMKNVSVVKSGEVLLSHNVAEKYNLGIGDTVYVEYPYSPRLFELVVSGLTDTEYDIENPIISNDIGIVYVGYDRDYVESTNCKYILFSKESQSQMLAEYPQVISGLLNKSESISNVFNQGVYALIFELIFLIGSIVLCNYFFFSKSFGILRRIYLKGYSRAVLTRMPFVERFIFWCAPCCLSIIVSNLFVPCNSELTKYFYMIPVSVSLIFIVFLWIHDSIKTH